MLRVEARKLFDTRSGMVLTACLLGLVIAAVVGRGFVAEPRFFRLAGTAAIPLAILLPVLAILTVTGEWRHRTALTTFTLESRRGRVLAAKCLPPLAATVVACLFALLVAVPATAMAAAVQGAEADWAVPPATVLGWVATMILITAQGLALGLALLNAPAAIVISLGSTAIWSAIGQLGDVGATLAGWLDLNTTTSPLTGGEAMTGGEAARLAVSVLAWIVIPAAFGALRVSRMDIT
ncbi:hypothetical protein [Nonomuraea sp. NPDC050783]|uniref:hypothetical protein n=1 Tax=Nonomuraea sp. NPDC050783 TaxID=3154634 RepID=UPI003465552F